MNAIKLTKADSMGEVWAGIRDSVLNHVCPGLRHHVYLQTERQVCMGNDYRVVPWEWIWDKMNDDLEIPLSVLFGVQDEKPE